MLALDNVTGLKEPRGVHKGTRLTVSNISGFRWFTWKGVKYFLYEPMVMYDIKFQMAKGRSKEEILDEMWDILQYVPTDTKPRN